MIKVRRAAERGKTATSWLDSNHTFSFNRYYDAEWSGFGDLLVINEDFVAPGQGFGTHSHDDMEILSYVVEGALEHRDNVACRHQIQPAVCVQPMGAARHRFVAPGFRGVQSLDQGKKAVFGAMDVGAQRHDFGTQGLGAHRFDSILDG